ncbi:precorrin-3B synthase [Streptomyces sp. NPDC097619]|uniref:precorrin-3B synthase n=1 Tax=Streptomyces sp. NPDC097619 TaxID=3157228 RepID=UPI00332FC708
MPPPPSSASRDEPVIRDRGDACPGALRLHPADDGHLARVRLPGGLLGPRQAELLADAADRFGDGQAEITSRGNLQLRGLAATCGTGLAHLLTEAGLLPAPAHERVRNIVATPLADTPTVPDWVRSLDRLLCTRERATALSGRFLFACDDGRGDVAALAPDLTLLARPDGRALLRLGASDAAVELSADEAPRAAVLAAEYFLDTAERAGTGAWRVAELPTGHALDEGEFAARATRDGIPAAVRTAVPWPYAPPPRPGITGRAPKAALCVLPPLGRLTSDQLRALARAARAAAGELRVTPWRQVVLPGPADPAGTAADLAAAGLVPDPDSAWEGVTACSGRPGCAKSLADVRADATAVVARARGPLPVHWSGCARRCGHPRGRDWVDLVATPTGYLLSRPAAPAPTGDGPTAPVPVPPAPDALAAALAAARTP